MNQNLRFLNIQLVTKFETYFFKNVSYSEPPDLSESSYHQSRASTIAQVAEVRYLPVFFAFRCFLLLLLRKTANF